MTSIHSIDTNSPLGASSGGEFYSLLKVNIETQELLCFTGSVLKRTYAVSTATKGKGETIGSEQTPRGWHKIHAKVGEDAPTNAVFVSRQWTGEIYHPDLAEANPKRDWILTRILWLEGLELGLNLGENVDTLSRYIYFHGSPDAVRMGVPGSHGCIRMRNEDILELFLRVQVDTKVYIV